MTVHDVGGRAPSVRPAPPTGPSVRPAVPAAGAGQRSDNPSGSAHLWIPGLTLGAVGAGAALSPSLFPRGPKIGAGIVLASGLAGLALGTAAELLARGVDEAAPGKRLHAQLGVAAAGTAIAGATLVATHRNPGVKTALVATSAGVIAGGAAVGAAATAASKADIPPGDSVPQLGLALLGGGALAALSIRDRRAVGSAVKLLPDVKLPRVATDPLLDDVTRVIKLEDSMPGVDPSTVRWDKIGRQGTRLLTERTSSAAITRVMGEAKAEPRRIYVGLDEAPEGLPEPALVEWLTDTAVSRMKAGGAFSARNIMAGATTSTGYINPLATLTHEMFAKGDSAIVAIQAGHKKAALELDNLDRATVIHKRLLEKIHEHAQTLPVAKRPDVRLYGESFGAWTSIDLFEGKGIDAFNKLGVRQAMYVGIPKGGVWSHQLPASDPSVLRLKNVVAAEPLTPADGEAARVTFLHHDADPVGLFSKDIFWRKPEHLKREPRGEGIHPRIKWYPFVTGAQTVVDTVAAQYFRKGVLEAKGHDYRPEVPYVMRRAYGFGDVTDLQVARVREYGRQLEVRHAETQAAAASGKS